MRTCVCFSLLIAVLPAAGADPAKPIVSGVATPWGITNTPDGTIYVTTTGKSDQAANGALLRIDDGKPTTLLPDLNSPSGVAVHGEWVYVADGDRVLRIGGKTRHPVYASPNTFPSPPRQLHDIVTDPRDGTAYVSDAGGPDGAGAAIYRISATGQVSRVTDATLLPGLRRPTGMVLDGVSHLLVADSATGTVYRVNLADGSGETIADRLGGAEGLTWDANGRLYISQRTKGTLAVIPRPGDKPVTVASGLRNPTGLAYDLASDSVLVVESAAGVVTAVRARVPEVGVAVDPLPVETELAFPKLKWTGWEPETPDGKSNPLRPIVFTHAGDGSGRVFVADQHGVVHAFPNDQDATETTVFLDIADRVRYNDKSNEEGFLGLAFHPKFQETGELFAFYTPQDEADVNVVSRFRVSPTDPTRADPASEERLLKIKKPFWNHDGGTLAFGPDGMLYITHGDGGSGNDPFDNGQSLDTHLGTILRIDVDHRDGGKAYAVPKDNPFVATKGAMPEIWAYGFRNIWRMAFDPKTGQLWAGDVGQNLFEEIDIVERGGNYGWNRREGLHPFGPRGTGPRKGLTDPIWEYSHDVGRSITGGAVYRGQRLPELDGAYIYGDYVTAKIWALRYDPDAKRVTENRPIQDRKLPILSFGQDETGELYLLTTATDGRGIYRFAAKK